ncbi:hypothetical protein BMS3Bbin04_02099 [bacterium BMS3Bbin04]|nr:hypothetical protein BMS3Bbin04_02099 [bacterium BMS3Bbin04]
MRSMMRMNLVTLLAIVLILLTGTVEAKTRMSDEDASQIMDNLGPVDPLAAADELSVGWRHLDAIQVLETYTDTSDSESLWRIARSRIDFAELMSDQEAAEPHFLLAIDEAERILANEPDNPEAHLRIATASGRVALLRGPFSAIGLVKDTYRHALQAAALGDSLPAASYILGRTHRTLMEKSGIIRRLAGLSFAAEDSIAYYFTQALTVAKGNMIQAHVEFADHLINDKDEIDEGRAHIEAALELPLKDEHDAEAQQKARDLLSGL